MRVITTFRGDTLVVPFTIARPDGTPVSIVGSTFWFTLKLDPEESDALAAFQGSTATGAVQTVDAPNGRAQVVMTAAQTAALVSGARYRWDLQQQDSAGRVTTLEAGLFHVRRDQTRAPNP